VKAFVVDTSALLAILNVEDDVERFRQALHIADAILISSATALEASCVAIRSDIRNGPVRLAELLDEISPEVWPFDSRQLAAARAANSLYGRGTAHKARLNMGDCFSYALAKTRNLPLLFKGNDFIHTDIEPALKPA
jgi:ribonuclease VapC